MAVPELRQSIPATESVTYLNTGASGPVPEPVADAIDACQRYHGTDAALEEGMGMYSYAGEVHDEARGAAAEFVGADPGEIALLPSTTDGVGAVADGLNWEPGDVVVRTDLEHPANIVPWEQVAEATDIEIRVLPTDRGRVDLDEVKALVEDAKLLSFSSMSWNYGTRLPVEEMTEIAHDAGALTLVDAVQSVGQEPIDVSEWNTDFLAGAGHKWLLGPWGAGFLYVGEDVVDQLRPVRSGARGVETIDGEYEFLPTAKRLEPSTMAVAPYAGLTQAIERTQEIGMTTIQSEIERLTDRLKAAVEDERRVSPDAYETGLVSFRDTDPEATVDALAEEGLLLRNVPDPGVVRASVHAFNTEEEIDALAAQL